MNFRRQLLTFHYSQGFACIPEAEGSSRFRFEGSCQENLLGSSVFMVGPGKRKRKAGNIRRLKVLCVRLRRRPVYPTVLLIHHAVCDRHVVQGILVTASHAGFLLLSLRWRRVLQRLGRIPSNSPTELCTIQSVRFVQIDYSVETTRQKKIRSVCILCMQFVSRSLFCIPSSLFAVLVAFWAVHAKFLPSWSTVLYPASCIPCFRNG